MTESRNLRQAFLALCSASEAETHSANMMESRRLGQQGKIDPELTDKTSGRIIFLENICGKDFLQGYSSGRWLGWLIWVIHHLAQLLLPYSHKPRQNWADSRAPEIQVNPTHVHAHVNLPVNTTVSPEIKSRTRKSTNYTYTHFATLKNTDRRLWKWEVPH